MPKLFVNLFAIACLFLVSCAKERPIEDIPANQWRFNKSHIVGKQFVMLEAISDAKYPGDELGILATTGFYIKQDALVQFNILEKALEVKSIDPLYEYSSDVEVNDTLASFAITKHVDVLPKQNDNNEDTHEIEETESRTTWDNRKYMVIDAADDSQSIFKNATSSAQAKSIEWDEATGTLNITVERNMNDGSFIKVNYSFKEYKPSQTYKQRLYPESDQREFGIFKTKTIGFDEFGRAVDFKTKDYMNRWDLSKPIVYYFSEKYPDHLKPVTREVFAQYNAAFKKATGKEKALEIRDYSGQEAGDLRYNMLYYVAERAGSRLLGYGPSVANPRTGEIVKADVFLYGGTLKAVLYRERLFLDQLDLKGITQPSGDTNPASSAKEATLKVFPELDFHKHLHVKKHTYQFTSEDANAVEDLRANYKAYAANKMPEVENKLLKDQMAYTTLVSPEILAPLAQSGALRSMTNKQLEVQIFRALLAHELGHNLGLRHNFKGSADAAHFQDGAKSSSIMDYVPGSENEPKGPAPYDVAAIEFAYTESAAVKQKLLDENYFFCTDHQAGYSRDPLCERHDLGISLSESAQHLEQRYVDSYLYRNVRRDQEFWTQTTSQYISGLFRFMTGHRNIFDSAEAIEEHFKRFRGVFIQANPSEADKASMDQALKNLWYLMGKRIEVVGPGENVIELTFDSGNKVYVSVQKILIALQDALEAKEHTLAALSKTIKGDFKMPVTSKDQNPEAQPDRPEFNQVNFETGELELRGVLYDKMVALLIMGTQTVDPVNPGSIGTSMFEVKSKEIASLFSTVLSNTDESGDIDFYQRSIREMLLGLIVDELSGTGLASSQVIELIASKPVQDNDNANKLQKVRNDKVFASVERTKAVIQKVFYSPEPEKVAELDQRIDDMAAKLTAADTALNDFEVTVVNTSAGSFELPLKVDLNLNQVDSATGRLVHQFINPFEDQSNILKQLVAHLDELRQVEDPTSPLFFNLTEVMMDMQDSLKFFSRFVYAEKLQIKEFYTEYKWQ